MDDLSHHWTGAETYEPYYLPGGSGRGPGRKCMGDALGTDALRYMVGCTYGAYRTEGVGNTWTNALRTHVGAGQNVGRDAQDRDGKSHEASDSDARDASTGHCQLRDHYLHGYRRRLLPRAIRLRLYAPARLAGLVARKIGRQGLRVRCDGFVTATQTSGRSSLSR